MLEHLKGRNIIFILSFMLQPGLQLLTRYIFSLFVPLYSTWGELLAF